MAGKKPTAGGKIGKALIGRSGASGQYAVRNARSGIKTDKVSKSAAGSALTVGFVGRSGIDKKIKGYNQAITEQNNRVRSSAILKKAGGSLVMTVPAPVRRALSLAAGTEMAVTIEGSKVIMEPVETVAAVQFRKPKYSLDDLVAGMNPDIPLTDEEREWMDAPAMGREVW